jgi:uncharacterized phage infection (PIP) family protein YhgE
MTPDRILSIIITNFEPLGHKTADLEKDMSKATTALSKFASSFVSIAKPAMDLQKEAEALLTDTGLGSDEARVKAELETLAISLKSFADISNQLDLITNTASELAANISKARKTYLNELELLKQRYKLGAKPARQSGYPPF